MLTGNYKEFHSSVRKFIPKDRVFTDELRKLTYGTDAGFYRLIPQIVVKVNNEDELQQLIKTANNHKIAVTFRAAGTSLSGQAISDSVLVLFGPDWKKHSIAEDASTITMQPGMIGAHANLFLSKYHKKLGPDPASINSAKIAGIAANNASGMTSGVKNNIYNTLNSMRIIFPDGAILDTSDEASKTAFANSHPEFMNGVKQLAKEITDNLKLSNRITQKYRMKNTTGYGLNSLVDYSDPFEIIQHLMIGSEGTLGCITNITLNTVPSLPHKASALILFPDIHTACSAIPIFQEMPVDAAEVMDRASLRSVEDKPGIPAYIKDLGNDAAALLVETSALEKETLKQNIEKIVNSIKDLPKEHEIEFTDVAKEFKKLWDVRKGLFPSACKSRIPGTSVIIEDVNFPTEKLADAVLDLQALFAKHGYNDTIIWGHSLVGNLHFVFAQDFSSDKEVERYRVFMDDICELVVKKYDGSLKAEHGTGRNMAPYVKYEWGEEAYDYMKKVKQLFDPENLFNPGVVINEDPEIHLKNFKPMPKANPLIDMCIECGFCEINCPSKDLTLTPRQRIVAWREIVNLRNTGANKERLKEFDKSFEYQGNDTCATDGLCATSCPVDIDTGKMIKKIREENASGLGNSIAGLVESNMGLVTDLAKLGLNGANIAHSVMGTTLMQSAATGMRKISGNTIPLWNKYMPKGADSIMVYPPQPEEQKVVYFPSCISRSMGPAKGDSDAVSQTTVTQRLLKKAGYAVIYPESMSRLCCGMAFNSKGFVKQGLTKSDELYESLKEASNNFEYPILFDTSPCTHHYREYLKGRNEQVKIYEPIEFALDYLVDKLEFTPTDEKVSIHTTCSSKKMGLDEKFYELTKLCSNNVIVPHDVGCCGWAGDRGFSYPELNDSALRNLKEQVKEAKEGYSTSRTCEIGLSMHSGKYYKSVLYLVDRVTTAKK